MALQRNAFLEELAQMSRTKRNTQVDQISYPLLADDLPTNQKYYQAAGIITAAINAVRRRQAVLQALEDEGLAAEVNAWIASGVRYRDHPSYQELVGVIRKFRTARPNATPQQWLLAIDQIYAKMMEGTY
jgi:hypothetical protein